MTTSSPGHDLDHGRSCIIVTGPPGAGKSTVALLVAQALSHSALLNRHAINRRIVSDHAGPSANQPTRPPARSDCATRTAASGRPTSSTAGSHPSSTGSSPTASSSTSTGTNWPLVASSSSFWHPASTFVRDRNTTRHPDEQFSFDGYESLVASTRAGFGSTGWWFDTSDLSPDKTASRIIQKAADRATVEKT